MLFLVGLNPCHSLLWLPVTKFLKLLRLFLTWKTVVTSTEGQDFKWQSNSLLLANVRRHRSHFLFPEIGEANRRWSNVCCNTFFFSQLLVYSYFYKISFDVSNTYIWGVNRLELPTNMSLPENTIFVLFNFCHLKSTRQNKYGE